MAKPPVPKTGERETASEFESQALRHFKQCSVGDCARPRTKGFKRCENHGGVDAKAAHRTATPVSHEQEGSSPSASSSTEHEALMEAAARANVGLSKGENGKKRKASVERYLYQFMRGHGQTATPAFKANWDATFGPKKERQVTIDIGNGVTATGNASDIICTSGEPKSYADEPLDFDEAPRAKRAR